MLDFEYYRPTTVDEAKSLLSDGAKLIAGGQTLVPTMKQGLAAPDGVVSLKSVNGLRDISEDEQFVQIGAMATHADVASSSTTRIRLPGLAKLAGGISDRHVRNRGTLGGSIANCDPAADYPAALLAMNATIVTDRREIAADAFFEGLFTTALEEDEIIVAVRVPTNQRLAYQKFSNPASRYAIVGVAVAAAPENIRVAVTGAGNDGVFRWSEAEEALDADFSQAAISRMTPDSVLMMGDIHASPSYRATLVRTMAGRAVAQLLSQS